MLWPDWIHPNSITLTGGLFASLSCVLMCHGSFFYAGISFTLYHACDNMDGKHARRTGQTSKLGGVLDHFIDGS